MARLEDPEVREQWIKDAALRIRQLTAECEGLREYNETLREKYAIMASAKETDNRTPASGGSGVMKECEHDFKFLRSLSVFKQSVGPGGTGTITVRDHTKIKDVFFCAHCLEYRDVVRNL